MYALVHVTLHVCVMMLHTLPMCHGMCGGHSVCYEPGVIYVCVCVCVCVHACDLLSFKQT